MCLLAEDQKVTEDAEEVATSRGDEVGNILHADTLQKPGIFYFTTNQFYNIV